MVSNTVSNGLPRLLFSFEAFRCRNSRKSEYLSTVFKLRETLLVVACRPETACNLLIQLQDNQKVCAGGSGGTECLTGTATGASKNT